MGLYVTQTLISAWQYMYDCREECAEDARDQFLRTLKRDRVEPTPAMQDGIEFENCVYAAAAGKKRDPHPCWEEGIKKVAAIIRKAPAQVPISATLRVLGVDLTLVGVADAINRGTIYDVKKSSKPFSSVDLAGKYLLSPQHPAYLYAVPEARDFVYLVSDGIDLYTERYTRNITRPFPDICREFVNSIRYLGLWSTYAQNWQR